MINTRSIRRLITRRTPVTIRLINQIEQGPKFRKSVCIVLTKVTIHG